MDGAGAITNANGGTLIDGGSTARIARRRLNTSGTTTWTNSYIQADNGGWICNTGTWDVTADGFWMSNPCGGTALFTNAGTFRKTGGSGATQIFVPFDNTGSVGAQTGTLSLAGGGTHTGSFAAAGTLEFASGTHDLGSGASVTGAGTLLGRNHAL